MVAPPNWRLVRHSTAYLHSYECDRDTIAVDAARARVIGVQRPILRVSTADDRYVSIAALEPKCWHNPYAEFGLDAETIDMLWE